MDNDILLAKTKRKPSVNSVKVVKFVILSAGNNNQYTTIEEVQIRNKDGVLVSHLAGNKGSGSSLYTAGAVSYSYDGPIDGNIGGGQINMWCPVVNNVATTARTLWWALTFSSLVDIVGIQMVTQSMYNRYPIDMDIEISSDGSTFSIWQKLRNLSGWQNGIFKTLV